MTIILSMSVSLCVCTCVFVCVYAHCLCMREQPSLFIKMSPVMAAKLTMCFGEQSWLDKSLCGRRCVWSTPIHLYCDLCQVGDPLLTGAPKHHLCRKDPTQRAKEETELPDSVPEIRQPNSKS